MQSSVTLVPLRILSTAQIAGCLSYELAVEFPRLALEAWRILCAGEVRHAKGASPPEGSTRMQPAPLKIAAPFELYRKAINAESIHRASTHAMPLNAVSF